MISMMSNIDWRYLRPALIVMALTIFLSSVLMFLGADFRTKMAQLYYSKQSELGDVELEFEKIREDERLTALYLTQFNTLKEEGIFDEKKRVDWVDAVNSARSKMKLPLVRYQISPQTSFSAEYLSGSEYVSVNVSQVKLEAGLLHEGDLKDLFKWMDLYAPGQLHVSHCEMKQMEAVFGYYGDSANLTVLCELNWYVISPLSGVEEVTDAG